MSLLKFTFKTTSYMCKYNIHLLINCNIKQLLKSLNYLFQVAYLSKQLETKRKSLSLPRIARSASFQMQSHQVPNFRKTTSKKDNPRENSRKKSHKKYLIWRRKVNLLFMKLKLVQVLKQRIILPLPASRTEFATL